MSERIDLVIDPGHGGKDPGAIGPTGLQEKSPALKISKKVGNILLTQNLSVALTRGDDRFLELHERVQIANSKNSKHFLSIHINSFIDKAANGTETYAYTSGGEGDKLAKAIQSSLVSDIKLRDRGVKYANFAVLRLTKMPAALIEVCFISSPAEESMLKDEIFLDKVAMAIAKGYLNYVGRTYKEPEQPKPVEENPIMHGIVTASALNVRDGAGTGYKILGVLENGAKVKIDKRYSQGDWYSVYYGDHGGFVHKNYIKLV